MAFDGRYRIDELIGRGGMAAVYRAEDVTLGRTVAIKVFDTSADELEGSHRRNSEIALLASITHRSLVTLFDASYDEATARGYLAMEYIDGDDLARRLQRGPIRFVDVARLLADLGEALHVVHEHGIVHLDVKPANVLLAHAAHPERTWYAKLADFGIARATNSTRPTANDPLVGTAAYLSPEQVTGAAAAPSCDVYSLGLIALEALTGERAFPGSPIESAAARLRHDAEIPASIPTEWSQLLSAMTAREPTDRPTALDVALRAEQLDTTVSIDAPMRPVVTSTVRTEEYEAVDSPTPAAARHGR